MRLFVCQTRQIRLSTNQTLTFDKKNFQTQTLFFLFFLLFPVLFLFRWRASFKRDTSSSFRCQTFFCFCFFPRTKNSLFLLRRKKKKQFFFVFHQDWSSLIRKKMELIFFYLIMPAALSTQSEWQHHCKTFSPLSVSLSLTRTHSLSLPLSLLFVSSVTL